MLSRSAKHLYWLARYVERAENIARMIDVNLELILDFPDDHSLNWKPLIDTLDINELFERGENTQTLSDKFSATCFNIFIPLALNPSSFVISINSSFFI